MFGFELQTNGNNFVEGVSPREVAWKSDDGLVTLEGDETYENPRWAELEFVTAPCKDLKTAQEAAATAQNLATALAREAHGNLGVVRFRDTQVFEKGTWTRTGSMVVKNPVFAAKPQVTVGVALPAMRRFLTTALTNTGAQLTVETLTSLRQLAALRFKEHSISPEVAGSPEMDGFLAACHYFLLKSFVYDIPYYAVDAEGRPGLPRDHDLWRVFEWDSQYLASLKYKGSAPLMTGRGNVCRVAVNRDAPKSLYEILHRTDFHAMFRLIPERLRAGITKDVLRDVLWPDLTWNRNFIMMVVPYRADPLEGRLQPVPVRRKGTGWKDGVRDTSTKVDYWYLTDGGPFYQDWCASVLEGRQAVDRGSNIPKDLASPPPGIRGRERAHLHEFPTSAEDKSTYYGMGAFPADKGGLAVYEHRAFASDSCIKHTQIGELVPSANWVKLVEAFHQTYQPA
ncbi:hypothetical protein I6A60_10070 [Frankia sp. AgB1.9]|uniref:hypothetical protein n=1 Tax=unclassified Frankia TaxID=2632575 RepID=UPI0019332BF2|nr:MULTISPECIES: hypothetical protein [unclassified Frankia]MBL7494322.1 hypothetical protein [Frankia sp. AgW1.1]MBL7548221.1 hypothetical protein [Frankia sp. AgB1.9]MBL7621697.1 hypothetical protein [Frankia sp. AgB1.8]